MAEVEQSDRHGIAVVEAALLIEAGADKDFDKVIVVTCDFEQKVERFARRTKVTLQVARAEVERRSAAQFSDKEKARRADYIVDNSGSAEDTERQVERIWRELQRIESLTTEN
jgi:dephospho-CoA kinase